MNPLAELRYFFTALGYFTRVPVPRWVGYEPQWLTAAARYFPLVGACVGALGALVYLAALRLFGPGVAVLLSMTATLAVTGAFHEDGLADCCDAFGGAYRREDVLRIMHDSRIGAFGAIALFVALALKWQTLVTLAVPQGASASSMTSVALTPWRLATLMIAAHAVSRACAVSYLVTLDYVRDEGKAKPVAQRMSVTAWLAACAFALPWLAWFVWPDWREGVAMIALLAVLRYALGRYFVRRIGGYTGDCLGFAQQVFEIALYLTALAWISF